MQLSCAHVIRTGCLLLLGCLGALSRGQTTVSTPPQDCTPPRIVRELRDPHTGARWLVIRNTKNPSGPGRMILSAGEDENPLGCGPKYSSEPIIHAGDRVAIEEHTADLDSSLDATAFDGAAIGSSFRARLKIGGKLVRAVAIAPGRAALASAVWPTTEKLP